MPKSGNGCKDAVGRQEPVTRKPVTRKPVTRKPVTRFEDDAIVTAEGIFTPEGELITPAEELLDED